MAAKGAEEKIQVFTKIKETFPNAFWEDENKILRIPINGVEMKVSLTCAKDNIGESQTNEWGSGIELASVSDTAKALSQPVEITEEEQKNVQELLTNLGIAF